MPINKEAFLRYRIIDRMLRNQSKPYPTMDDFIDELEEQLGKSFSISTVQKDIKAMKEDELLGYKAPIKYNRAYHGYYYSDANFSIMEVPLGEQDLDAIEFAAVVLQQYKNIDLFKEFGSAVDKIFNAISVNSIANEEGMNDIIQFEKTPSYQGNDWLQILLNHIKNRQTIKIEYKRFEDNSSKEHEIHPILLKEYRNRWYLISMLEKNNHIVIYALDRIIGVDKANFSYRFNPDFSSKNYFRHAYGITTFEDKAAAEVLLSCTPTQAAYFKTQALHSTQKIIKESEKEVQIQLNVGITIELIMDILSFGANVKVLKPKSLQEEIKKRLQETLALY